MIIKSNDNLTSQAKMYTKYLNMKTNYKNKGKLIITEIFPSLQKRDIQKYWDFYHLYLFVFMELNK